MKNKKLFHRRARKGRRALYFFFNAFNHRVRSDYDSNGPDAPNGQSREFYAWDVQSPRMVKILKQPLSSLKIKKITLTTIAETRLSY
jgi:hypothetical protein